MNGILVDCADKSFKDIKNIDINEIDNIIGCESYILPISLYNGSCVYCEVDALFKPQKGGALMRDLGFPILGKFLVLDCEMEYLNSQISWLSEALAETWRSKF